MTRDYYAAVTRQTVQSKSPVERGMRCHADQRRLKREAAERREAASAAPETPVARRSYTR